MNRRGQPGRRACPPPRNKEKPRTARAVIAGVAGLIGDNLAEHLLAKDWEAHGTARKPQSVIHGVRPVAADLLEPETLRSWPGTAP